MKKNKIAIIVTALMTSVSWASGYVVIVEGEDTTYKGDYEIESKITYGEWLQISENSCNYTPLNNTVYFDHSFDQDKECSITKERDVITTRTYASGKETVETKKESKTEIEIETIVSKGDHLESNCNNILSFDNKFLNQDGLFKTLNNEIVYCDMTREGGGWTLIAAVANDNQDYWYFSAPIYQGGETGSANERNKDYQNKHWKDLSANNLMITDSIDSKYALYPSVLNGETMGSKHPIQISNSTTYTASKVVGSWWVSSCSDTTNLHMKTQSLDSDTPIDHVNASHSRGFTWMSKNNGSCSWDDTYGGINGSNQNPNSTANFTENGWTPNQFYKNNFSNNALNVFVK